MAAVRREEHDLGGKHHSLELTRKKMIDPLLPVCLERVARSCSRRILERVLNKGLATPAQFPKAPVFRRYHCSPQNSATKLQIYLAAEARDGVVNAILSSRLQFPFSTAVPPRNEEVPLSEPWDGSNAGGSNCSFPVGICQMISAFRSIVIAPSPRQKTSFPVNASA